MYPMPLRKEAKVLPRYRPAWHFRRARYG